MGTDIHILAHARRQKMWQPVEPTGTDDWYGGRNYDLFGILANVRNGVGFAGIVTGEAWPSIAPDRGLPADLASDGYNVGQWDRLEYWGDHSFTWLTLAELHAYPWDDISVTTYGIVALKEYNPGHRPKIYSKGVSGAKVVEVTEDQLHAGVALPNGSHVYVRQQWTWTAREACGVRWWDAVARLDEAAAKAAVSPGDFRLTLGFDS